MNNHIPQWLYLFLSVNGAPGVKDSIYIETSISALHILVEKTYLFHVSIGLTKYQWQILIDSIEQENVNPKSVTYQALQRRIMIR